MTPSLKSSVMKAAAFDESQLHKDFEVIKDGIRWQTTLDYRFLYGAKHMNARLRPLIEKLAECVNAATAMREGNGFANEYTDAQGDAFDEALAKLAALEAEMGAG